MKIKLLIAGILVLLAAVGIYLYQAVKKFEYKINVVSLKAKSIDLPRGKGVLNIVLDILIKSALPFNIPVSYLFYEVYYKDNLLGRSADTTGFELLKEPSDTRLQESIDIYLDKTNIQVLENYINKKPTEYIAKIKANVFGMNISLKKIPFTY